MVSIGELVFLLFLNVQLRFLPVSCHGCTRCFAFHVGLYASRARAPCVVELFALV